MTAIDFLQSFREFLGRNGWPTDQSPWSIVEQWESLVDQARTGYQWGYYEYANEISVRDLLAKAFRDEKLKRFKQVAAMRDRVDQADVQLQQVLLPDVQIGAAEQPWWRRRVLARAGEEYVDDMIRLYGIEVGR
jgi:hypothetical protein